MRGGKREKDREKEDGGGRRGEEVERSEKGRSEGMGGGGKYFGIYVVN